MKSNIRLNNHVSWLVGNPVPVPRYWARSRKLKHLSRKTRPLPLICQPFWRRACFILAPSTAQEVLLYSVSEPIRGVHCPPYEVRYYLTVPRYMLLTRVPSKIVIGTGTSPVS